MKKKMILLTVVILAVLAAASCASKGDDTITLDPMENGGNVLLPAVDGPAVGGPADMPARPGSDVTGDPSVNLPELVDVSGTVKEVNEGLVLITCGDGGDFMLRFSENSKFAEGVSQEIKVGNKVSCTVKLEPTFAPPSQGEVFEVMENTAVN